MTETVTIPMVKLCGCDVSVMQLCEIKTKREVGGSETTACGAEPFLLNNYNYRGSPETKNQGLQQ